MFSASTSHADTWNAGTGDWFTPGNWANGSVPTGTYSVEINNGGTAQVEAPGAQASSISIGAMAFSSGTLQISNGGSVSNLSSIIGGGPASTGTVTVDGAGSAWTSVGLIVGDIGAGTLTVQDGGRVRADLIHLGSTGSGTLNIDGTAGSRGVVEATALREGSGTGEINFDGGILRALQDEGNFLQNFEPGDVTINAGGAFFDTNGFNINPFAAMDGTGGLTKEGAGTLTLSRINTYTGGTTINEGTISIGADNHLGNTGGTLTFDGGTLQTTASFSTSRATTLNAGDGTFSVDAGTTLTHSGRISGAGTLIKTGDGTLTLSAVNNYSGGTVASQGMLRLINVAIFTAGNIANDATVEFNVGSISENYTNVMSGTGNLVKTGSGMLIIFGANTYTGGTTISDGTLAIVSTAGSVVGDIVNQGTLRFHRLNAYTHTGDVSGTGAVTHTGTGTTTITGDLTHTGGTTITAGTLQIGNGGTTGSISGDITNNSSLIFNRSDAVTFGGDISGNGYLTKQGTGTLTLTGSNTYSGDTTIEAGTLAISNANALGSGDVYVAGGELLATQSLTLNPGAIVATAGPTNTFSAASGTTLSLAPAGFLVGTAGNVVFGSSGNDGIVEFGPSLGVGGSFVGSTLTVSYGTLRATNTHLSGITSWFDTTTVSAGATLDFNDHMIGGSGFKNLQGSGIVNTGSGAATNIGIGEGDFSGTIQGAGQITKTGAGTLILSGDNTYTGGTTISAGTLQIGNGGTTGSISGDITNNTSLIFNRSDAVTFGGDISGTGTMQQNGTGNLNLTGTNAYTGATTINSGILSVNGSIVSDTTINAGGTLGGSGTVGNVVINGGTLAPGNSIGTLNVAGNVDFSGGGTYAVEVNAAGNSDKINATGTATLTNGTVLVLPEAGNYNLSTDYTILTAAGGLGGTTFNSVSSTLAFLTPTLTYDANNVFLNLVRNDVSFATVADTPNQVAVGTVINTLSNTNPNGIQEILDNLFILTPDGANQAYDSLSGVQHTHGNLIALQSINQFKGILFDRISGNNQFQANNGQIMLAYNDTDTMRDTGNQLFDGTLSPQRGWWLRGTGNFGDIDDTRNATGASYKAGGIAAGLDFDLTPDFTAGAAIGYTRTDADVANGGLDVDSYQTALYGRLMLNDGYYLSGMAGLGYHDLESNRSITAGLMNTSAEADYDAWTGNIAIEGGRTFTLNANTDTSTSITPFAGLEYAHIKRDRFTEKDGGTTNLRINEDTQDSLRSAIGARIAHSWTKGKYLIQPTAELAWVHEFMEDEASIRAGFAAAPSTTFTVDGPDLARDRARLALGLNVQLSQTANLNLGYQGEFASSDERHDLAATFRMEW